MRNLAANLLDLPDSRSELVHRLQSVDVLSRQVRQTVRLKELTQQ